MNITKFLDEFGTEEKCIEYLANARWGGKNKAVCPHCNCTKVYMTAHRIPFKCSGCKKRFSVKTKTVFAESNIKLTKWFMAMYFIGTANKGMSSVELAQKLGVTQKTSWFVAHRLREACQRFYKISGTVEMDETFIGGKEANKHESKKLKHGRGTVDKVAVVGAISREEKQAIAYPVANVNYDTVATFRNKHIEPQSAIIADECTAYDRHTMLRVNHSKKQYVDGLIHTNSIESFWATIKRGYIGIYHHGAKNI